MNQPPFNPLKELSTDPTGITHRANKRLREWMEHHNAAYESENCPIGGCDQDSVKPQNQAIDCGSCLKVNFHGEDQGCIMIDWDTVNRRMNEWVKKTQNPECHEVFFRYNNEICEEFAREDDPPVVDERKIKHKNSLEGHHEFFYEICKETEYLVPRINTILLDHLWGWVQDQGDIKLEEIEFGIVHEYTDGYPNYDKPIKACVRVKASFP